MGYNDNCTGGITSQTSIMKTMVDLHVYPYESTLFYFLSVLENTTEVTRINIPLYFSLKNSHPLYAQCVCIIDTVSLIFVWMIEADHGLYPNHDSY